MEDSQNHHVKWKKSDKKLHFVQFYLYEISRKGNIVVTEEKSVFAWVQKWGQFVKGHEWSFYVDHNKSV